MKTIPALAVASLLVFSAPLHAIPPPLVATVTGTTTVEEDALASATTIKVEPLNNHRIIDEFGVSSDDYVVVVQGNLLRLFPKAKMSVLPLVDVMTFTPGVFVVHKTKPNTTRGLGAVVGTATTNIFNNVIGTYQFTLTIPATAGAVATATNTVTAGGATHLGSQANKSLIMNFKVKTGKVFVPK